MKKEHETYTVHVKSFDSAGGIDKIKLAKKVFEKMGKNCTTKFQGTS